MGLADIFKPRSATNPAAYVPKAKMPTNQLASPRYTNVINNLEQNFKSPSARGASGGGGGAFKQAAGVLKKGGAVAAFAAGFLAADFLFNPQGKGISDDTNAAKREPNPYLNGTKPFSGLNPGTPTYEPTVPFYGGQEEGVLYQVTIQTVDYGNRKECKGAPDIKNHLVKNVIGPVRRTEVEHRSFSLGGGAQINYEVFFRLYYSNNVNLATTFYTCGTPCNEKNKDGFKAYITKIERMDGQPDTGGDPPPTEERPSEGGSPPGLLMSPRPAPPVTPETPSAPSRPKAPPRPLNNPDKSAPPAPSPDPNTPQPNPAPSPTPAPVPQTNPTSREFWSPKPSQVTPSSGIGPAPITPVAPTPAQITPSTGVGPAPPAPAPTQKPTVPAPTNDPSKRTTPEAPPTPKTEPPPEKTPTDKLTDLLNQINTIGAGIVGIGTIIGGIAKNTTPEAIETAAAAGTCRTTQPGGCTSNLVNGAADKINQNTNNQTNGLQNFLNNASNLANLTLLPIINNKLGNQITGGLSGGIGRMSKFLGIDRAISLLTFLSTVHNASMLTASLKVTLLEMLSSIGNATGLLETSEGDNVDLNQVFNQGIELFITKLIGVDAYASMKVTWRKYNTIYRAATNSLNSVANMFNSMGNALQTIGEHTGKMGNALRAAGAVHESAYQWFSERIPAKANFITRYETRVGQAIEVFEVVNEIAENVVESQQAATEFQKANKEFVEALQNAEKSEKIENKLIAEEAKKIKENSIKDPTGEPEKGLLSFLTD